MKNIPWYPLGMTVEPGLIAIMAPKGEITEKNWWEELTDRVADLILAEEDPQEAAVWACQAMDLPETEDPHQAAEVLVLHNLMLRTAMNLLIQEEPPFPAMVQEPMEEAMTALDEVTLEDWINLAEPMMR